MLNRKCGLIWLASASILAASSSFSCSSQPVFDAGVVPDLDRRRHRQHGGQQHQQQHRHRLRTRGVQREQAVAPAQSQALAQELQRDRREQQHDLPVHGHGPHHVPGAAVKPGEHERREMPDRFLGTQLAESAAGESAADRERQRRPLTVAERRHPDHHADDGAGVRAGDEAGEKRALERQVGGVVVEEQPRHDAGHQRNAQAEGEDQPIGRGRAARRSGCDGTGGSAPAWWPAPPSRRA